MGTAASLPYDEATLRKLRGVITMRYHGTEPESAVPMRDGVEMVFECATEEQVVEVPQSVLPMVYGRGHEAHSFHNRAPPLSDPSELEGDQEFQRREKTLEASIQAQYRLDDSEKDAVGYISEMPAIHPLHIERRWRARLMKSDGNLQTALERTKVGVEAQKRRELEELRKNKNKKPQETPRVAEPSWDKIEADQGAEERALTGDGRAKQEERGDQGNRTNAQDSKGKQGNRANAQDSKGQQGNRTNAQDSKGQQGNRANAQDSKAANTGKPKNASKETQPPPSKAGTKTSSVRQGKALEEEKKVDFDAVAVNKEKKKIIGFEQEERERQLRRKEELARQRTQERLLHIINDF